MINVRTRILILALLTLGFTTSAASLDINDSDPLQYHSGGDLDFEVQTNGNTDVRGNLSLGSGQEIQDYYDSEQCGEFRAVKGIYPNGTYICTDEILEEKTEYLNETLAAGNTAERSINMTGDNVDNIGSLNSNGTDLNISGDVDFEENLIQNVDAVQDGGSDSLIFDDSQNLFLPNGDLDLEGSTINDTSTLQNDGELTINSDSENSDSGDLVLQTGSSDRAVVTNDGQIKSFGNLNLTQSELDQASRIDFFSNGNTGFIEEQSSDQLAINSQGDILRLQSDNNQEVSVESVLELNENNLDGINAIRDGSDTDSLVFEEDNDLEVPSGDLNVSGGDFLLRDGSSGAPSLSFYQDEDTGIYRSSPDRLDIGTNGGKEISVRDSLTRIESGTLRLTGGVIDELGGTTDANAGTIRLANAENISWRSSEDDADFGIAGTSAETIDLRNTGGNDIARFKDSQEIQIPSGYLNLSQNRIYGGAESDISFGNNDPEDIVANISSGGQFEVYNQGSQIYYANGNNLVLQNGNLNANGRNITNLDAIYADGSDSNIDFEDGGEVEIPNGDLSVQQRITDAGETDIVNASSGGRRNLDDGNGNALVTVGGSDTSTDAEGVTSVSNSSGYVTARFNDNSNVEIPNGNLQMDNNSITEVSALYDNESNANFFEDSCDDGDIITSINADGSLNCKSTSDQVTDIWVNETGDNVTGDLDLNNNDIIEVDEFRTNGTGDDEIAFRDTQNTRDIARFNETGSVRIPSGNLNLKQSGDAGNDIVNVNEIAGRDNLNLSGEGNTQGVAIQQGDGTTILDAGTGNTDVIVPNGDLDLRNNNIDNITSIDGDGDEIRADDGINVDQNNLTDVNKIGFGESNKIKSGSGGRMCIGNRCS